MTLESPWILLLLVPTALSVGLARTWALRRREALRRYLEVEPRGQFWPSAPESGEKAEPPSSWGTGRVVAGACMVIGLAGVTVGTRDVTVQPSNSPVILLVDISASMGVQDLPWGRLGAAKNILRRLAPDLGAGPVGLTVFADQAYPLLPPTVDMGLLFSYLDALDPAMVTGRGTSIDGALDAAAEIAAAPQASETPRFILISDGEEAFPNSSGEEAARRIRRAGGQLATIATGTSEGGPVPSYLLPGATPGISRADADRMRRLAQAGGGPSLSLESLGDLQTFSNWLNQGAANSADFTSNTEPLPIDRWAWFTALAAGALLFGSVQRRSRITRAEVHV